MVFWWFYICFIWLVLVIVLRDVFGRWESFFVICSCYFFVCREDYVFDVFFFWINLINWIVSDFVVWNVFKYNKGILNFLIWC